MTIVAFTGHRPDKLGGYGDTPLRRAVTAALRQRLVELRPAVAISGMALGVDQWAAQLCIDLGIPWDAYVPFVGQESKWPPDSQRTYRGLLERARQTVVVCHGGYENWKFQRRNEAMVNGCGVLIAVWDGSPGGTANCVGYAAKYPNVRIVRIDPRELVT